MKKTCCPPPPQIVINVQREWVYSHKELFIVSNGNSSVLTFFPLSSIIFFCCGTLDEILEHLFVQWMFVEPEKRDTTLIQKMTTKFDAAISHVEKLLRDRKFVCGEE